MKKADVVYNVLKVPVDGIALMGAGVFTYALRIKLLDAWWPVQFGTELPFPLFLLLVAIASGLFLIVYAIAGLYAMRVRMSSAQESARIIVASSGAMALVLLAIFLRAELFNSRFLVLGFWILATISVTAGRLLLRSLFHMLMRRWQVGVSRVLLIGNDQLTQDLVLTMENPSHGSRIVETMEEPNLDHIRELMNGGGLDEVILAVPHYPSDRVVPLVDFCHENHITFRFVPNIYQTLTTHYDVDALGHIPVLSLRRTSLDGWGKVFKRVFDIAFASLMLTLLLPLFAILAFAIKWESYGPVFVRLARISRNRRFNLLKFRSMIAIDADGSADSLKVALVASNERTDGPLFKMKDDPRITRVGKFIRRTRLDELPQFFNVLRGEMSVIGPRPHQPDEIARYQKHHKKVLAIKAGASGMAQVSGSSDLPFEEEVVLDTFYIENWSMLLDFRIIIKTALKMLGDRSAV